MCKAERQIVGFVLTVLMLMSGFATAQELPLIGKNQFNIQNGVLMRGTSPFVIQAVRVPGFLEATLSREEAMRILNGIAEVGGTTICFDLADVQSFADNPDPEVVQRLSTLMTQVTWRRLGAICRIPAKEEWHAPDSYEEALRHAAEVLRDINTVIYWIDGDNPRKPLEIFRKAAPELVLAASKNAPLKIVPYGGGEPPENKDKTLPIYYGPVPPASAIGKKFFMIDGRPENLAGLDKVMALPIESEPWSPDNSVLSDAERGEGWISLFDGNTLNGWVIVGPNPNGFKVIDGAIVRAETNGIMLRTRDRYDNFILRLEWKINPGGNSGIFLRAPRYGRSSKIGMEFQLMGDSGTPVKADSTGAIYDVLPPIKNAAKPEGEWNSLEITLNGSRFVAVLNGETVQDVDLDASEELRVRLKKGFIALQDHGHPAAFRNIRIKPL